MISTGPNLKTILSVNLSFLAATSFGLIAKMSWQAEDRGLFLTLIALMSGYSASLLTLSALKKIIKTVLRDLAIHRFLKQGRASRSDEMVDETRLRKSKVIE